MYGYWEETDKDPDPHLEKLCANYIHENLPLLQTEFTCEPVPCGDLEAPSAYSCSGWDPEGMVTYWNGVHYMDYGDAGGLVYDFLPLIFCDDARLRALENGGFEVEDADAGELLYELGLRDGDIPIELNGYPLDDIGDVGEAFAELWLTDGEDTFDLYLLRGSSYVTLYYTVVYTL